MAHIWWIIGAVNGFLVVAAGAFGAHGLKNRLTPEMLDVFETGVRYHMFHAVALLAVGRLATRVSTTCVNASGWCFTLGILVFSGSLYVLAITGIRKLGMITPIGGVLFLVGWALLAVAGSKLKNS